MNLFGRTLLRSFWQAASAFLLLLSLASAQTPGDSLNGFGSMRDRLANAESYSTEPGTGVLALKVFAERNGVHLDRQALLKLVNRSNQAVMWETTDEHAQGVFTNIPFGVYDIEVSAVGYLSDHKEVVMGASLIQVPLEVALHKDPSAVDLDMSDGIPTPKARKETKRAISALKSGNLKEAQKQLDAAFASSPTSADVNFLMGYLYFQKKDFTRAGTYLSTAANLNPRNAQALTLLGRTGLERKDYPGARSALEKAILADSENWLPHNLLADAYLHEKNYTKASSEAQIAITKGRNAATSAQLVLGEALVNLGREQEGVQALTSFLKDSPQHPVAGQIRDLIANIEEHRADGPAQTATASSLRLEGVDPLLALPTARLSVKSWQPPDVDDIKMTIAPDVACPTERVVEESGKRVQELVEDLTRFSAVEDLFHQPLDDYGTPLRTETRKYNYVAAISEPQPGFLEVDEFRTDKITLSEYPDHIASTGFASLAFVFHPHMRDSFELVCEGLGDWHGQASWLVHFRQRDDRPNHMHSYKVGNSYHPVKLKGRAWITADKFQIVRIEADMVSPMPEIALLSEHQAVEYGPIPFASRKTTLWLPKSAEIYFDFRKRRYYRKHSFDHYMLFSSDSTEKTTEPVAAPPAKQPPVEHQQIR